MKRYGTGKAGQYPKLQALRHFHRMINRIIIFTAVGAGILGIAVGYALFPFIFVHLPFTRRIPALTIWVVVFVLIGTAAAFVGQLYHRFQKPLDDIAKERVRYLRGGQTEALVAFVLHGLDDKWHLFNGVAMKGGGDIDHVLIGPGGLFSLSTKATRGVYSRKDQGKVLLNGEPNSDVAEAQRLALTLRNWLEARLQADSTVRSIPFVQPVLVAPFAHVDFPCQEMNVWVMDEQQLYDHAFDSKAKLKPAVVAGCVEVLKQLTGWEEMQPKVTDKI